GTRPRAMKAAAPLRDVAIIGAGVIGLCAALALQQAGCRVTLLDRQPPGAGCSSGNAGGIARRGDGTPGGRSDDRPAATGRSYAVSRRSLRLARLGWTISNRPFRKMHR